MSNQDTPNNGDFASYLKTTAKLKEPSAAESNENPNGEALVFVDGVPVGSSMQQVLAGGLESSDEFLEEMTALNDLPALTDEELDSQALNDPGADGDIRTPE